MPHAPAPSDGEAVGHASWIALPFAALALVCVLFIREVLLRTTILREDEMARREGGRESAPITEVVESRVAR